MSRKRRRTEGAATSLPSFPSFNKFRMSGWGRPPLTVLSILQQVQDERMGAAALIVLSILQQVQDERRGAAALSTVLPA